MSSGGHRATSDLASLGLIHATTTTRPHEGVPRRARTRAAKLRKVSRVAPGPGRTSRAPKSNHRTRARGSARGTPNARAHTLVPAGTARFLAAVVPPVTGTGRRHAEAVKGSLRSASGRPLTASPSRRQTSLPGGPGGGWPRRVPGRPRARAAVPCGALPAHTTRRRDGRGRPGGPGVRRSSG